MEKILIAAPQHQSKNYCFDRWADNVRGFTHDNFDVFLADNSPDESNLDTITSKGFMATHVKENKLGTWFTLRDAHNACRDFFLSKDYDFMLHLETDVFPPIDVIERLLNNKRTVCAGTYDILFGSERKAMIQTDEFFHRNVRSTPRVIEYLGNSEPVFFDGTVKQVYHAGMGCVLIKRSILFEIPFEAYEGVDLHPDTLFANRLHEYNVPVFVDTSVICGHSNSSWIGKKIV